MRKVEVSERRARGARRASARVPSHAAFLRGINLGPRRRASSADLRSAFERMGLRDVATLRSSGNVVFSAGRASEAKLRARIEAGLATALGFEVTIFLRTAGEMRALANREPFPRKVLEASRGKLQVALLSTKPAPGLRKEVLALATADDRLAFGSRELYWLPSAGTRDSALNLKAIETLLGATTMRTKGTIDELAAKHFAG
jgi:uncharacterized protein (DUF1697 family)